MFLKRIEMYGFKSFADRITISFDSNMTGIVGPNGCGKSNISDAIRWVLGEQSIKSLRGEKMTDVIFAGAENRRALNMAEVTLVFDNSNHALNSELEEIEVTRRTDTICAITDSTRAGGDQNETLSLGIFTCPNFDD